MGLFDLDEYQQRRKRADESATPPRSFPLAYANVHFNGQKQKLHFAPFLLDGRHIFISFRPENAAPAWIPDQAIRSIGPD
ncbi:hypothetical protein IAD21_01781 [Abditibacteriota bacterium]|nr:hypothetical protein IAD21_01781 [Abditibacteriota bacterium]